jgi:outer membrane protein assembly factor BamE
MNIRQGNIIEQEDVSAIRKGMTKAQIRYLLGQPLVNDSFADDQWYYINTFKNGRTGQETRQELIIQFDASQSVINVISNDFELPEEFQKQTKAQAQND